MPSIISKLNTVLLVLAWSSIPILMASCAQDRATSSPTLVTPTAAGKTPGVSIPPVLQTPWVVTPDVGTTSFAPTLSSAVSTPRTTPNKLGIHLLLDDGRNAWPQEVWDEHLWYAREIAGEWGFVTELVRLDSLDAEHWQYFMDLCAELHLTPVLRLATTYDPEMQWWNTPPSDPDGTYSSVAQQYADFISKLSWPTEAHYVIVGNEPNHGNEWGGKPNPLEYARFLIDVATAIHATDPDALVLNAGFDNFTPHTGSYPFVDNMYYMDAESFLDQMYDVYPEVFTHIDVWASHSYPLGPFAVEPWRQTYAIDLLNDAHNPDHVTPPPHIYNRGINGYAWELFKLNTYGIDSLPVMITETGWQHAEAIGVASLTNQHPLPNADTVKAYFDLAFYGNDGRYPAFPEGGWIPWLEDARVIGVTPFALNGWPVEWGHTNWLMLNEHGEVLGTYAPFHLFATRNAPQ